MSRNLFCRAKQFRIYLLIGQSCLYAARVYRNSRYSIRRDHQNTKKFRANENDNSEYDSSFYPRVVHTFVLSVIVSFVAGLNLILLKKVITHKSDKTKT